ncbi:uncharacterized protein OCT59_018876 [Rhizophagus irregularis]|uniref:G-protein coupled receptors family 1 profile domain-containing protein n=2 Tax=Rhizophagus irregularis TaxID=588596 RepID=A0A015K6G1_RHIIW|nr:hypothetical protein GLOIN_2v1645982 [Rhizophagus irregularis DAOM 181602=DAOM 197198]EXX77367.1 hypothetical protein RirG_024380 [Rhizophagus irregularis DAOM 197198w]POG67530.1 hypothetical protein GLOIN_2v1645982 [Rhizophagus irregularis DAOM 181602=DAOM 197198]UZO26662.1 hypothetical protein OCT59_018876 [Rhizophagus irregularis]|eukprot:XP_025174396.1 hypothetical protein GLOIN_2v1645982 [Rhizophagus irregularis DAOM 181602=DAOM 197198]
MDTSTTNQTSKPSTNFKIVIIFGLVMIIINGVCASYMLSRTLSRWYITKKSLPMALRVPFYIALSDFIIFSINFPNMLYPNIYGVPWSSSVCKVIGGVTSFAIAINMTLVGLLAFLTYLRICRKMYIDLGRYDYKGVLFVLITSSTYSLISIPSYDSGKYWCFTNNNSIRILPILTLTLNFTVLIITIFSYSSILIEINSIRFMNEHSKERNERNVNISSNENSNENSINEISINENISNESNEDNEGNEGNEGKNNNNDDNSNNNNNNNNNNKKNSFISRTRSMLSRSNSNNNNNNNENNTTKKNTKKIEPIVVRKIIGYVLIFIIQWTPPMIYVLGQIIDYDPLWVYLITDATVNMGGIGNMIQFIINEGWRDRYHHTSSKETSTTSSSYVGIETSAPTPSINILPRVYTSDESKFELKIKIDTSTSINLENYYFENNGKLRPYSTSTTSTKVSNEDSNTIVDINSDANTKNT